MKYGENVGFLTAEGKLKRTLFVMSIAILALAVLVTLATINTEAAEITVGDGVEYDYATIGAAIENATAGDTITVSAGSYNLTTPILVDKSLTLTGDIVAPGNVIVNAPTSDIDRDVFQIISDDVTIQGFTIQGAKDVADGAGKTNSGIAVGGDYFILGEKPDGATEFTFSWWGIGVSSIMIQNNIITDNSYGVFVFHSQDVTIQFNEIYGNTYDGDTAGTWSGKGVEIYSQPSMTLESKVSSGSALLPSKNILVHGNNIYDNGLFGIELNYNEGYNLDGEEKPGPFDVSVIITDNNIYSNGQEGNYPWGDYDIYRGISANGNEQNVSVQGNTIYGHTASSGSNFTSANAGIRISSSFGWTIENNEIYDNMRGIYAYGTSTNITIDEGNEIYSNAQGIVLANGTTGTISNNKIYSNDNDTWDSDGISSANVYNMGDVNLDATYNYWGDAAGPGTSVSANVDYSPWYVDEEMTLSAHHYVGSADSIQDAIDAVDAGGTVFVGAGTYNEDIVINKTLSLVGESAATTILDAGGIGVHVVIVTANNVEVTGFTIRNSGFQDEYGGVALMGVTGAHIHGNTIINNVGGVGLVASSGNIIEYNMLTGNAYGVFVGNDETPSTNNTIRFNTIQNSFNDGIYMGKACNGNTIDNNTITLNGAGGIFAWKSSWNTITYNNINNNTASGIQLFGSNNNTVYGNIIENNGVGIEIRESQVEPTGDNTFTNNTISGNTVELSMPNWENIELYFSTISDFTYLDVSMTVGAPGLTGAISRYWSIDTDMVGFEVDIVFTYAEGDLPANVFSGFEDSLAVFYNDGSGWTRENDATLSVDIVANTVTLTGLTHFTDFTLAGTTLQATDATPAAVMRGQENVSIMRLDLTVSADNELLANVNVTFVGEDAGDIAEVKLYIDDGTALFDPATNTLLGTATFVGGVASFTPNVVLAPGDYRIWIAYNIAGDATLGNNVGGHIAAGDFVLDVAGSNLNNIDTGGSAQIQAGIWDPFDIYGGIYTPDMGEAANADVTITNVETGEVVTTQADDWGQYYYDLGTLVYGYSHDDLFYVNATWVNATGVTLYGKNPSNLDTSGYAYQMDVHIEQLQIVDNLTMTLDVPDGTYEVYEEIAIDQTLVVMEVPNGSTLQTIVVGLNSTNLNHGDTVDYTTSWDGAWGNVSDVVPMTYDANTNTLNWLGEHLIGQPGWIEVTLENEFGAPTTYMIQLELLEYSTYVFDYVVPEPVVQLEETFVDVTFETNVTGDLGYDGVRFMFGAVGPGNVSFTAFDGTSWHTFVNNGYWGPASGFDLPALYTATTNWNLTFSEPGVYTITFSLVDAVTEEVIADITDNVIIQVLDPIVLLQDGTGLVLDSNINVVTATTTYPEMPYHVVLMDYATDVLIESSVPFVVGTEITIVLAGTSYGTAVLTVETSSIYLSELMVLAGVDPAITRTPILGHSGMVLVSEFTIVSPVDVDTVVTATVQISDDDFTTNIIGLAQDTTLLQFTYSTYVFDYVVPEPVVQLEETFVDVTFQTDVLGDLGYDGVRFMFGAVGPGNVSFTAFDGTSWHTFVNNGYWGPASGFDLPALYTATTNWNLTFSEPGVYTITFSLVDAVTEEVIADITDNVEITVLDPIVLLQDGTDVVLDSLNNVVTATTTYPPMLYHVVLMDYATDVLIESSVPFVVGTEITIVLAGTSYGTAVLTVETGSIYLSELMVLAGVDPAITRTPILGHSNMVLVSEFTIVSPIDVATTVTATVQISDDDFTTNIIDLAQDTTLLQFTYSTYVFDYVVPEPVVQLEETFVDVTFQTDVLGDLGYDGVRFIFSAVGPGNVSFTAFDGTSWHTFVNNGYWGPASGFDLPALYTATTNWNLTFSEPGVYTITFSLVDAVTEEVIADITDNVEITVLDPIVLLQDGTDVVLDSLNNVVTATTTYPPMPYHVVLMDYATDVLIESSVPFVVGTEITIVLAGTSYGTAVLAEETSSIYLSELMVLAGVDPAITRTPILGHSNMVLVSEFTIVSPIDVATTVTATVQISDDDFTTNIIDLAQDMVALVFTVIIEHTYNFEAGWNMVGVPMLNAMHGMEAFNSASSFEASPDVKAVVRWDVNTQSYVFYIVGFTKDPARDFALNPDEGYWVWSEGISSLDITGEYAGERNVALVVGWNLVNYAGALEGDVGTDWAPHVSAGEADAIARWDSTSQAFEYYHFPSDTMSLEPGRAYFVWSDEVTTLTYSG